MYLADPFLVPWPVVWLVGMHNEKHRFTGRTLPDNNNIFPAINRTMKKTIWILELGHSESSDSKFENTSNRMIKPFDKV